MDKFFEALINNAPGIAGIVFVVILFLKAQEKAMAQWTAILSQYTSLFTTQRDALNMLVVSIQNLEKTLVSHDTWEREVIGDIQENQQNVITTKLRAARKQK